MKARAAVLCLLFLQPAAANPVVVKDHPWADSHANWGLFADNRTLLRIASEDLYISPDAVRIRYVLANDTKAARQEHLSFPMPEIEVGKYWFDHRPAGQQHARLGRHTADPENFLGVEVRVNGKPVPVEVYQIARTGWPTANGSADISDVSGMIKAAGLPVMLFGKSDVLDKLPEAVRRRLFDAHVLGAGDDDWRPGTYPKTYRPNWRVVTGFSWSQSFPAHGTVTVDVRYQPMTGGSLRAVRGEQLGWETGEACYRDWVFPDWTPWGLSRRKAARYRTTGYILTTASYWNGPIGRFHLTVDKENPQAVLSLCWDGKLKKTGPTTYEFTAAHFRPKQNIRMVVFE